MDYQELLKAIQTEAKSKIEFKKDLRNVYMLEEYIDAHEQYVYELISSNSSYRYSQNKSNPIDGEDVEFHKNINRFMAELINIDIRKFKKDSQSLRLAGIAYAIMGKCFLRGLLGNPRNIETAIDYFTKSASCKNPAGTYELGKCFEYGIGVERDSCRAIFLYRVSYKLGYIKGLHRYALLLIKGSAFVPRSVLDGYYILKQAISLNDRIYLSPYYDLAMLYRSGVCDIFNDHNYAFRILNIGASKGCRYCQYKLGEEWEIGKIVEPSLENAFFWYKMSAKNNFFDAQLKVAQILYGIETLSNTEEIKNRKLEALAEGQVDLNEDYRFDKSYVMTELEIGVLRKKPILDFQSTYGPDFDRLTEGFKMARMAAKNGKVGGILLVAEALEKGFGVEKDALESIWWYGIADALGADNIRERIHLLEVKLGKKVV